MRQDVQAPAQTLLTLFAAWKAVLLAVAAGSALVPSYDTSSTLVPAAPAESALATRLTRWDAVYFVQAARRGYLFEQEWAFGSGLPLLTAGLVKGLKYLGLGLHEAVVACSVAHVSHFFAVLVLYYLTLTIWKSQRLALVASILHTLSPAGIFLSAPYAEAPCALFSFLGYLLFAKRCHSGDQAPLLGHVYTLLAGASFGVATVFRSNGLLNGIVFAHEVARELLGSADRPTFASVARLASLGIGGLLVACGSIIPQWVAYETFCSGASGPGATTPWCGQLVPSIYTFVQQRYWNVGFLRYWTLSNIPLFLLGAPMISIMIFSGFNILRETLDLPSSSGSSSSRPAKPDGPGQTRSLTSLVQSMAVLQMLLAMLATTNYHVQVITRLSSGYPVWCWWLAMCLGDPVSAGLGRKVVIFMVMYALIQGALFACFLPPA